LSQTPSRTYAGKIYDPVFLCMVGAVALAVGTSIGLRVMIAGAGPTAAHAADPQSANPDNDPYTHTAHPIPATRPSH